MGLLMFGGGDTVRRCFGLGPDSGAAGLFIGGLCLVSRSGHDGVLGCPVY